MGALTGRLAAITALIVGVTAAGPAGAQVTVDLQMSDGVSLATDIYANTFEPQPVLLVRTPYGREGLSAVAWSLADTFDAKVVVQDTRGQGDSEGEDEVFRTDGDDGRETLEWIDALGWSNGRVGGWGASALAITQTLMAPGAGPTYTCQYVVAGTSDLMDGATYVGGVRRVELDDWLAEQGVPEVAEEWAAHPDPDDPYWDPVRVDAAEVAATETVGLHVTGWFDLFLGGTIGWYQALQDGGGTLARSRQHLVIGPFAHDGSTGELTFPDLDVGDPVPALEAAWSEECLHGAELDHPVLGDLPAVSVFVMGATDVDHAPGNRWESFDAWPPLAAPTELYLRADGRLELEPPVANEPSDAYSHVPFAPVPVVGGSHLTLPSGPFDQATIEARDDVAVYTSAILTEPAEVIGPVSAKLYVHSSVDVTDVVVRLSDVYPDGRSMLMASGIRRFAGTGKPQEVVIDMAATGVVFDAGHQIRLSVAGAMAGAFEIAPEPFTALIAHSSAQPSHVLLPVRSGLGVDELPDPELVGPGAELEDPPTAEPTPDAWTDATPDAATDAFVDGSDVGPWPEPDADDPVDAPPSDDEDAAASSPDSTGGGPTPDGVDGPGPDTSAPDAGAEDPPGGGGGGGCGGCSTGGGSAWPFALVLGAWLAGRRRRHPLGSA